MKKRTPDLKKEELAGKPLMLSVNRFGSLPVTFYSKQKKIHLKLQVAIESTRSFPLSILKIRPFSAFFS
jgi:hypothetical protein